MGPNGIRGTRGVPCARGKRRADHHRRCFDVLGQRSSGWGRCDGRFDGGWLPWPASLGVPLHVVHSTETAAGM